MVGTLKHIAGIILAAGKGLRMGSTKQLLPFGSTTLLGQVVSAAKASNLDEIIVVLGHHAEEIQKKTDLSGTSVVVNPRYADGQSTSLHAGLSAINEDCRGVMFLLGDQPLVDHHTINVLIDAWHHSMRPLVLPYCNGKRGNPVIIGDMLFNAVFSIRGDCGARTLFKQHPELIDRVDIDNPAILTDVDTREEYDRLTASGTQSDIEQ